MQGSVLRQKTIQAKIAQQRTNLADVGYLNLDSVTKVVESFENPVIEAGVCYRGVDISSR